MAELMQTQLLGRYRLLESIGSGGMATVYKAIDEESGETVAVKVLKEEHSGDADFLRRFELEGKAALTLSHPNIVHSIDVGQDGELHYIVFEYVEGSTLKEIIRTEGPLTSREAVSVAVQVLDALEHAHSNGIIHRDVKPQNVMITPRGIAMLTDFGIARDAASTTRTFAGTNVIGSVHYLSPEQARGDQVGPESDVYSCGIMLYEMLTGKVPFGGENSVAIALKHLQEEIRPPASINGRIPRALSDVVVKAAAKKKELRYQSAAAMREDLLRALREPHGRFARIDTAKNRGKDEKEAGAPKRRFGIGNIALLILLVLGMFTALFFTVRAMRESGALAGGTEYMIPSLQGKKLEEAKELAALRGFTLMESETRMESEEFAEGTIISQTPESGIRGKEGDTITVVVSAGGEHTGVPNFIGMTLQAALLEAEENDLQLAEPVYMASELPDGQIFNQDPAAEATVFKGDTVQIWISGEEDQSIPMPKLIGESLDNALQALTESGFEKIFIHPQTPETDGQENRVMRQNPSAGMNAPAAIPVDVYVGRSYLGDYTADLAFNVDIADAEKTVLVTVQLSEQMESVLYSTVLGVGSKQSVSFTAYLDQKGEFPAHLYIDGERAKSMTAVFTERKN